MLGATLAVAPLALEVDEAGAADNGSVDVAVSGPPSILHGEDVTYTVAATHNGGGPDGYNLTYRVVLPADATFVSSTVGKPTTTVTDAPGAGETTLLFENVADLQSGVTNALSLTIDVVEASYPVGSSVTVTGGAYLSDDPRLIPDFDASGGHVDNADTAAFATDSSVTDVEAIRLTKTEPNAEAELLRGVHTEWTTYSLQVDNNLVNPTDSLVIEDWIPAGLEFLACGGVDQTEDSPVTNLTSATTEEYAGSGALGVGVAPVDPTGGAVVATCELPTSVETVTLAADEEFPGQPAGVYTHVVWDLGVIVGTMAASDQVEIMYAAGIPLRENTATFSAGNTNTDHTADLDNNNGPFTVDEQELTNWSRASANYNPGVDDLATSDEDSVTVSAEDLSIHKSVDDAEFVQSELPGWTMLIETGEYRDATGLVVTDTLPDGQCPILSSGNPDASDPTTECLQTGGIPVPTVDGAGDDPDTVTEAADGSWTLVWSTIPDLTENDDYTITFTSRVRDFYQESGADDTPVVGADAFANDVDISATTAPIDDGGTELDRVTETTLDESSAGQASAVVVIDKSVSEPSAPGVVLDCDAATYTSDVPPTPDEAGPAYRPGDRVCFKIRVDFLGDLHFRNPRVTDFIPPNTTFETMWGLDGFGATAASDAVIDDVYDYEAGPGTAPSGSTDNGLEWTLGSTIPGGGADLYVDNTADTFEVIFSVRIDGEPRDATGVDIFDNLAKLTLQNNDNSGGVTFSSRDQAGFPQVEPHIVLDKRNAPSGGTTDDGAETGTQLDVFDYEVDITNDFADLGAANDYATAYGIDFWDILPAELVCADVTTAPALSVAGSVTCLDDGDGGYPLGGQATDGRSVIEGTVISLAPQATATLSYSLTLPATVTAGDSHVNDAGVRTYEGSDDNVGSGGGTDYYPTDNIDEANAGLENTGAADDTATVTVPGVGAVKVQGSSDTDASGGTNRSNSPESTALQDATIGEFITYTFTVTVREGTDLYDGRIEDTLDFEIDFVSFDGGSLSLDNGATTIPLTINGSFDDAYFDVDSSGTETAADVLVDYDAAGDDVDVFFPAVWNNDDGSLDDLVSVSYTTIVRDGGGVDIGDNVNNTIEVDTDDIDGNPLPTVSSTQIRTRVVEPNPQVTKTDDGTDTDSPADGLSNVSPGDSITYTLTVANPAISGGNTSAAFDLVVTDVLPEGVTFDAGSGADNPDGGVFAAGTPVGAEGTITWTQAEVAGLAGIQVGDSLDITYTVTVDDPAVTSALLTNTATVTGESREADTAEERDDYTDSDTDTVELPLAAIAKDVQPFDADPFDGSDTDTTTYAVGEPFDFEVTVAVPANTQAYDLTVFDTLPAFLEFESYGAATDISASCERIGGGALAPGDVIALTPSGQDLGWYLGDVFADAAECRVTLPISVHVDDSATTASTGANAATVEWNQSDDISSDPAAVSDVSGLTYDEAAGPAAETVEVIEPLILIDKDVEVLPGPTACEPSADADTCDTESGATHRFTVTVFNVGDGDAHDVVVVDTLPAEGAGDPFNITGTPAPTFDGAGPRTLTWDITGPIASGGGSVAFTYDVLIGTSAVLEDDQDLVNTAAVTSYWGLSESDRESAPSVLINPDVPEYHVERNAVTPDAVTLTVGFPDLIIEKTPAAGMDDSDARVGEDFRWRLEVFNDGPGTAFDVDVGDALPTGWLYESGSATIDTGAGSGPLVDPAGGTAGPLAWTDVVDQLDPGDSFVIEFDTQPQASLLALGTTGTFDHVNDSSVTGDDASGASTNETGDYGDDNGAPDGIRGSDDDSARIRRVDLELDKAIVETAPYFFGDFVTYRITVTNDDSTVAVDTATGVTVLDVLPSEVLYDSSSTANGSYDDGTGLWTLASPLTPGASATLDIVGRINASTPFTNVAEVESVDQWDVDSTPGNHDDGTGPAEDDDDSVLLTPTNADLGNRLWFDVDADGEQDPGEPGIPGVDVTVSWIDPGDLSTVMQMTTTNADGEYAFVGLPQDVDLSVTIDAGDLPPGLTQTFELVDDPTITDPPASNRETPGDEDGTVSAIELTGANPSYLDVDFGFTGTGSIGDEVWFDADADGVRDGGEAGLDGVDVTVAWAGFDGILGDDPATAGVDESADDVSYPTTTAGGGFYLVPNLPGGNYTVSIDPATIPSGLAPTYDLDGGRDRTTDVTLGDGQNRLDVDFGEHPEADLEIEKSSPADFVVGSEAVWTITVTNNGPAVADGVIEVGDEVPAGVVPVRVEATGWTCLIDGQSVGCTLDAPSLAVGDSASFDLVVDVEPGAAPGVTNTATVATTGGPVDPDPTNDTDSDSPAVPLALLGVDKELVGDLVSGDEATWRITVTNYGPSPTTGDYTVTDDLPPTLSYVRAESDDGFSCSAVGAVVDCVGSTPLAVGDTAVVDLITIVEAEPGEAVVNGANVTGGTAPNDEPLDQDTIDEIFDENGESLGVPDDAVTSDETSPELAITGREVGRMILLALLAILAGALFVYATRRDEPVLASPSS